MVVLDFVVPNFYRHPKRLRNTLKKFLDNRSKWFANTTQIFFDKQGFQKLLKNLKIFICIWTNWQINFEKKKVTLPVFSPCFKFFLIPIPKWKKMKKCNEVHKLLKNLNEDYNWFPATSFHICKNFKTQLKNYWTSKCFVIFFFFFFLKLKPS